MLIIALPLAWQVVETPAAIRMVAILLMISIFSAIFIRVISEQQQKLEMLAATNPLTGLCNRVLLNETIERAVEQSRRTGTPMAIVTLDIDHFKCINDTFGHAVGDQVLRGIGGLLRSRVRCTARVFRFIVRTIEKLCRLRKDCGRRLRQILC